MTTSSQTPWPSSDGKFCGNETKIVTQLVTLNYCVHVQRHLLNHMLLTHTLSPVNQALDYEWLHQVKLPDQAQTLDGKFRGNETKTATQLVTSIIL